MKLFDIEIQFYIASLIGAFTLYFAFCSRNKLNIRVLKYILPKHSNHPLVHLIDSIIISSLGAVLCTIITQPSNFQQAAISGLGWIGLLNGFGSIGGNSNED